jgi:hypothetical protein
LAFIFSFRHIIKLGLLYFIKPKYKRKKGREKII